MHLPNYQRAIVPRAKIVGHLLSASHREGRGKARFFTRFGFTADSWQALVEALVRHVIDHEVASIEPSPFGTRYTVDGALKAPDGRTPYVRSVWFIETGEELPRFVTAYPLRLKGREHDPRTR
ncbi:MAG TPA: hypothetical protein VJG32_00665 [Anaerolineae bacterium]|nr:hypothetical protein [Anaerolineae bacterium]